MSARSRTAFPSVLLSDSMVKLLLRAKRDVSTIFYRLRPGRWIYLFKESWKWEGAAERSLSAAFLHLR